MMSAVLGLLGFVSGFALSTNAVQRAINYWLNSEWPNQLIDINTAIILYYRGYIDDHELREIAASYGYNYQQLQYLLLFNRYWLSPDEFVNWAFRQGLEESQIIQELRAWGFDQEKAQQFVTIHKRLMQISELIALRRRGEISDEEYLINMHKLGIDQDQANKLYKLSEQLLNASELITAYRRGFITEEQFYQDMEKLGFPREKADLLFQISWAYPGPQDWIRFAVRDVFNPQIVQKYGYDEEFPTGIIEYAAKAGVDEQTLRWYWRAHWELPSPTQAYVMLHRLRPEVLEVLGEKYKKMGLDPSKIQTDLDTIRELLKIADYPKYWRDRLIAISFNPLTRVDLRRIYRMGLISDEECLARLMEYGYTEEDAKLLLQWFKLEKLPNPKDLTMSTILKAYEDGFFDRDTTKELLMQLGYDEDEAELLIREREHKMQEEYASEVEKTLAVQFLLGYIDESTLIGQLAELGYPAHKISRIVWQLRQRKKRTIRVLSKEDVHVLVKAGLMTLQQAFQYLTEKMNYTEEDASLLVRLWALELGLAPGQPGWPGGPGPGGPQQPGPGPPGGGQGGGVEIPHPPGGGP